MSVTTYQTTENWRCWKWVNFRSSGILSLPLVNMSSLAIRVQFINFWCFLVSDTGQTQPYSQGVHIFTRTIIPHFVIYRFISQQRSERLWITGVCMCFFILHSHPKTGKVLKPLLAEAVLHYSGVKVQSAFWQKNFVKLHSSNTK